MNPAEFMPLIDPIDAIIIPFLADPNADPRKKDDVRSRRDNINRYLKDLGDTLAKSKEDTKQRIQREIDNINRVMAP